MTILALLLSKPINFQYRNIIENLLTLNLLPEPNIVIRASYNDTIGAQFNLSFTHSSISLSLSHPRTPSNLASRCAISSYAALSGDNCSRRYTLNIYIYAAKAVAASAFHAAAKQTE